MVLFRLNENKGKTAIVRVTNGLVYDIHENSYLESQGVKNSFSELWSFDGSVFPDALKTIDQNIQDQAVSYLLSKQLFAGFQLSEDVKNWLLPEYDMRIFVDNDLILETTEKPTELAALKAIFDRIIAENEAAGTKFVFRGKTQTVLYRNFIESADEPILTPYFNTQIFTELQNA